MYLGQHLVDCQNLIISVFVIWYLCCVNKCFSYVARQMQKTQEGNLLINTSRDEGQAKRVYIDDKVVRVMDGDVVLEALVQIEHHIVLVEQGTQPLGDLRNM